MTSTKQFFLDMSITIPITFIVAAMVTFLYNLIVHGSGTVDWDTSFFLSILLGIVLPLSRAAGTRKAGA